MINIDLFYHPTGISVSGEITDFGGIIKRDNSENRRKDGRF